MTSGCDESDDVEMARMEPMRPEDLDEVLAIEYVSFPSAWSRESYLRELRNPSSHYFVARIGREIIGYAGMWVVLREAHISTLAVHPKRRRRGLGERLLCDLMQVAKRRGATRATLEVREANQPARALYEKCGFRTGNVLPNYYGDTGENAVVMWKPLSSESSRERPE